jgi:release factor glutamine methyltransferase
VLIPRPETEHLVEVALAHAEETERPLRILDLCTGSGCVGITLAAHLPKCRVTAVDIAPKAMALARKNAEHVGVRVRLLQGDLFAALPANEPPFDFITANPPYVETGEWNTLAPDITRYEDKQALLAGADGLDCVRRIVAAAPGHLTAGGGIALEIGEKQYDAVAALLSGAGFGAIDAACDLAGIRRIISGRWSG